MKRIVRWLLGAMVLGSCALLLSVLIPRRYDVPRMKDRTGTRYWELPTGSRIAYWKVPAGGDRHKPPIIFLQGGPGGIISDRLIELEGRFTTDGHDVYLYDQVGSGRSERLGDITEYTAERHARDLDAIVDAVGSERVILIGQSWGAMLATLYVADHPERVDRLIVTGPGPVLPVRHELADVKAPDSLHLRTPMYTNRQANEEMATVRTEAMSRCARWFGGKLASDEEADDFQTLLNSRLMRSTVCDTSRAWTVEGGNGYYAQVMTVKSFAAVTDTRPRLRNCPVPILVMKGQCDNQPWGFTNEYLELFPHHQLVVMTGAGHSISVEKEDEYVRTIREFLATR